MIMTSKLSIEEAKALRKKWIKSILVDSAGYFATNKCSIKLGLAYGEDVGGAFRREVRKMQSEARRKLSVEEVISLYESFESELKR